MIRRTDPVVPEEPTPWFRWKVEGSSLSIGYENSEEPRYTYHQLTKEEYEMFQAFDKTAIIGNNP